MGYPVVHFEINTASQSDLARFYEEAFGWTTHADGVDYLQINTNRPPNTEAIERPHRVREEGDAGADRGNAGRPLQHEDLMPGTAQADRGAHASNPSPDDDHTHGVMTWRPVLERNP
jgi:hypothetical protein